MAECDGAFVRRRLLAAGWSLGVHTDSPAGVCVILLHTSGRWARGVASTDDGAFMAAECDARAAIGEDGAGTASVSVAPAGLEPFGELSRRLEAVSLGERVVLDRETFARVRAALRSLRFMDDLTGALEALDTAKANHARVLALRPPDLDEARMATDSELAWLVLRQESEFAVAKAQSRADMVRRGYLWDRQHGQEDARREIRR